MQEMQERAADEGTVHWGMPATRQGHADGGFACRPAGAQPSFQASKLPSLQKKPPDRSGGFWIGAVRRVSYLALRAALMAAWAAARRAIGTR